MHVFSCVRIVHFIATRSNKWFHKLNIFSCNAHLFSLVNISTFLRKCLFCYVFFVTQVRTTRNSVMHSADFTFTTAEMKTHLHCMTDLLREPKLHVQSLGTAAQDAIDEINQVRQWAD